MQNSSSDIDLRALRLLRRRWYVILGVAVVAGALTFGLTSLRTEQYQATAAVRVVDQSAATVINRQPAGQPLREVNTQLEVVRSDSIRRAADEKIGATANQVTSVTVEPVADADLIQITATSPSPEVAAQAANAIADVYVEQRRTEISSDLKANAANLRAKTEELSGQVDIVDLAIREAANDPRRVGELETERRGLSDQINELRLKASEYDVEADLRAGTVQTINRAEVPTSPSSPKPVRDALLAAVLAALAAAAAIIIADRLDNRVRGATSLSRIHDAPQLLGTIPAIDTKKSDPTHLVVAGTPEAEAFRKLRSAVWFYAVRTETRSIAVTSANPSEGKSLVSVNLATSLAASGARIALVSADLRAASIGRFFGIDETERGLSEHLAGMVPAEDTFRTVEFDEHSILFVPAGPPPADPGVLLGSAAMSDFIGKLTTSGIDLVILDSAPVGPVGDTIDLAQTVDGVITVVREGQTRLSEINGAMEALRRTGSNVIGTVLNATKLGPDGYGYGYGYGYGGKPASAESDAD